jgi:hypothetical protein
MSAQVRSDLGEGVIGMLRRSSMSLWRSFDRVGVRKRHISICRSVYQHVATPKYHQIMLKEIL